MKILLAVHQFFPDHSRGTEVLTYETARELKRSGHEVEVLTAHRACNGAPENTSFDTYVYGGVTVHRYSHNPGVVPPGSNSMEFEHNNPFFAKRFSDLLKQLKPDLVHFFHLLNLTPVAIDVCIAEGVPILFTPTDFWTICQTILLRLENNDLCEGPDPDGHNCIRHLIGISGPRPVSSLASKLPGSLLDLFVWGSKRAWWPDKRFSPMLRAVAERKDFNLARINRVDRVLVPTSFMEKVLVENGLGHKNIRLQPFGLNLDLFEGSVFKVPGDKLRVGFIGTLSEHKGSQVLVKAIKQLPAELPLEVKIYGGPDVDKDFVFRLKRLAKGDDRIQFFGTFPNEQIGDIFKGIDVLVVPSIWYENTPLVIYSAFASMTPVIATNLGGMSDVVHDGVNGMLFEKNDVEGLAARLRRLVEEKGLVEKLASGIEPPKSIKTYVGELEGLYREVLAERAGVVKT